MAVPVAGVAVPVAGVAVPVAGVAVPVAAMAVGVAVRLVLVGVLGGVVGVVRPSILAAGRSLDVVTGTVFFDFYGTLARAVSWGPTLEALLATRGLVMNDEARQSWRAEMSDGLVHAEASVDRESYMAWELERVRRKVEACGAEAADVEDIAAEVYAATKAFTLEAYEEVPEVLTRLRQRGVTIAVCSNWDWDLDKALAKAGIDHLIDVAVTSAQAGARKPHPRIYEHTLERCRVGPDEVLFVGDTWGPDVEGPLAVGLRPVHVWREGEPGAQGDPPPLVDGVQRLPDLRGVVDLVGSGQAGMNESRT